MLYDLYLYEHVQHWKRTASVVLSGADPGFVVRGGVSRRGVWGPRPQWVQGRALVGGPGDEAPPPPEALGV